MSEEQLYEKLRALSVTCPFKITIKNRCEPMEPLVTLNTNRFHWLTRVLVNLAMKIGQIEVFVDVGGGNMKRIRFAEGNTVRYGQDMRWHTGIPHGIWFDVEILGDDKVRLRAPGYGHPYPHYGNGAIYLSRQLNEREAGA